MSVSVGILLTRFVYEYAQLYFRKRNVLLTNDYLIRNLKSLWWDRPDIVPCYIEPVLTASAPLFKYFEFSYPINMFWLYPILNIRTACPQDYSLTKQMGVFVRFHEGNYLRKFSHWIQNK